MLELLTVASFVGYIIYLKYYADPRSAAEKQADQLREGITLYQNEQLATALAYFNEALRTQPKLGVAYLYRARIYRILGDTEAALTDLTLAKSYDDTIADLHLETGQLHYEKGDYKTAFQDFDKAIFHEATADAYRWRGQTRQRLGEPAEAAQDLNKAETMAATPAESGTLPPPPRRLLDRALAINLAFTTVNAVVLLVVVKKSPVIHWPYLLAAFSAGAIGFAEPRRGWILALWQSLLLWIGYMFVVGPTDSSVDREVELFSLYGSIGLTFMCSLLGGVVKRAQATPGRK